MNKNILKVAVLAVSVGLVGLMVSCKDKDDPCGDLGKVGGLIEDLLFPIQNDVTLGAQVAHQIDSIYAADILPQAGNEEAYAYVNAMVNSILASEDVENKDLFVWDVTIIDQDVLNAFATPGGYIYVYTGLIKYLDNVDDLAGVMGHEIAHADRRHSINQMKKAYGVQILLSIVAGGESSTLTELALALAANAASLKFSRDDETEADAASVEYLDETQFACNGAAEFFRKLEAEGGVGVPEFLSTHPNPENRVVEIDARAKCRGCSTENTNTLVSGRTYAEFKALF